MSIRYELMGLFGWAQNEVAELKLDLVPISLCKICNSISSSELANVISVLSVVPQESKIIMGLAFYGCGGKDQTTALMGGMMDKSVFQQTQSAIAPSSV